ncbi:MAG: siphovirus Gp157 family protein [Peptococcaceae bacterium]|nr:siphovirus Gp157 family protein [Peptococcaceae bacterium]
MPSLYELDAAYRQLQERLYDDEYDDQAVIDTLDSIEGAIEDKADGYGKILRMLDADIAEIKQEETRLSARRKSLERRKEVLKGNLFNAMKTVGVPKIKTALFTVSIRKNGGKRSLILDCGVDKLPPEFQKVTIEANNEALRQLLGDSESCEYCHLAEQGESLSIK